MAKRNRRWSEIEKYQLWLAYRLKTPLGIMSQCFKRGPSAINHALERFKIRPTGLRSSGPLSWRMQSSANIPKRPTSCHQLEKIFQRCGWDKEVDRLPTYWSPISKMDLEPLVILNRRAKYHFKQLELSILPPWLQPIEKAATSAHESQARKTQAIFMAREELQLSKEAFPEVSKKQRLKRQHLAQSVFLWVSFYDVTEYLDSHAVAVKPASDSTLRANQQLRYRLDGKTVTRAQVLVRANKIRVAQGEEPFLVKSISGI